MKKRALISVFDKTGILEFAQFLNQKGVEIISTGGTYKFLKENGLSVIDVSEVTNFKEMLDGRVKTLHPNIHGGILAIRDNKEHMDTIAKEGIEVLDKWTEMLDAEALEEKREQIEKAKDYCKDCLDASQTLIEAIEATEPKKDL